MGDTKDWKVEESVNEGINSRIVYLDDGTRLKGKIIATVNESENAHLIAAAPRMYEALKVASTRIHNSIHYEPTGEYRVMMQKDLKQIEQALAEADGRES